MSGPEKKTLSLDGMDYELSVWKRVERPLDVPRLLIPSYMPNANAVRILKACVDTIARFTPEEAYELWIVDNHSPAENVKEVASWPGINFAASHTSPRPPESRGWWSRLRHRGTGSQVKWGSYANAAALELGVRLLDPATKYLLTLHMDIMACSDRWLDCLLDKLDDQTRAAGYCTEKARFPEGVLHVLGTLVDYQLFQELGIEFWPELPGMDVGDRTTLKLKEAGYRVWGCPNTYETPDLEAKLTSPEAMLNVKVLRSCDEDGSILFAHLGRGIPKAEDRYVGATDGASIWCDAAAKLVEGA